MINVFIRFFNMSISACWLIIALVITRFILKRASKKPVCILWGFAAIRLVCPLTISSRTSLIPSGAVLPQNIAEQSHPHIDSGFAAVDDIVNPLLEKTFPAEHAAAEFRSVLQTAAIIWVIGAAVMLLFALISYVRIKKSVRASISVSDNIRACDEVRSPFILGIIKPEIYIPSSIDETTLAYVLTHEKEHINTDDQLWKPFGYLLLSLHWFNPLCWLAYILFCRDLEMACDERVIRHYDKDEKALYSQALLDCCSDGKAISAYPLAFGETNVKNRVKHILSFVKTSWLIKAGAILLCIVIIACFFTNPLENKIQRYTKILGVDLFGGKELFYENTHGGMSDGHTLIHLQYPDNNLEDEISSSSAWHKLPLSENLQAFLDRLSKSFGGSVSLPQVNNGFYYFYDRHPEAKDPYSDKELLSRYSTNCTLAIFDSDADILYILEQDT